MVKYYRKSVPATPVYIGGMKIKFDTNDRETGFFATDNEWLQNQFAARIAAGQAGLVEIDATEFDSEFVKKKGLVRPKPSPVLELRAGIPPDTMLPKHPVAAVATEPKVQLIPEPEEVVPGEIVDEPIKLKVGKRRMRRRNTVETSA